MEQLNESAIRLDQGDWSGALVWATRAAAHGQPAALFNQALAFNHLGRELDSLKSARRSASSGDIKGQKMLAQLLWGRGRQRRAHGILHRALECSGESATSLDLAQWDWLVNQGTGLQELLRGHERSERAVEFAPDLAEILVAQGKTAQAEELLSWAVSQGCANARLPLGNLQWERGRPRGALKQFRHGVEPGDAHSAFNAGLVLLELGDVDEARRSFRRAATMGDGRARRKLSRLSAARKRLRRRFGGAHAAKW